MQAFSTSSNDARDQWYGLMHHIIMAEIRMVMAEIQTNLHFLPIADH
jgi:hypothetical protein